MKRFWDRWLLGFSLLFTLLGLFIALAHRSHIFDGLFGDPITEVFNRSYPLEDPFSNERGFYLALMGTLMASMGVFMIYTSLFLFPKREKSFRNATLIAIILWFVLDQFWSSFYGVWFNVIFNTPFCLLWLLPFLFTWKEFKGSKG